MTQQILKSKNDIIFFVERFCYIRDKETNECRKIKLSKAQKRAIKHLNKLKEE